MPWRVGLRGHAAGSRDKDGQAHAGIRPKFTRGYTPERFIGANRRCSKGEALSMGHQIKQRHQFGRARVTARRPKFRGTARGAFCGSPLRGDGGSVPANEHIGRSRSAHRRALGW